MSVYTIALLLICSKWFFSFSFEQQSLWLEYYHDKDSFGETHANAHIQAYNQDLREKRKAYAEANPGVKFEDLIKATYTDEPGKKLPGN